MRLAALAVVLGLALATASAAAGPCSVTVAWAPDGVREVVDHWVEAEPSCSAALEVRIVATDAGLSIIARDDRGRVHERVVPDAQTAGVLIASWAADDTVPSEAPPSEHEPTRPGVATARPADALGVAAGTDSRLPRAHESRWVRLAFSRGIAAAMLSPDITISQTLSSVGLRGSAGVWNHGAWTLDASLDVVASHPVIVGRPGGDMEIHEYSAFANLGYVLRSGQVSLTPSVGLGARYATFFYSVADRPHMFDEQGMMCVGQVSALGAIDLADRWQLTAGVSATFHPDPWMVRENMELVWIGGVGWAM